MKTCSHCKVNRPLTEFSKHSGNSDGLQHKCKGCFSRYNKARYSANKEAVLEANRRWARRNTDKVVAYKKNWHSKNRDRLLEKKTEYNAINAEARNEYMREYGQTPMGWAANKANGHNQRAKRYGCSGRLTARNVLDLYAYYGHKCLDCGSRDGLSLDHVKPLSMGGTNWPANLQVVCMSCNHKRWDIY